MKIQNFGDLIPKYLGENAKPKHAMALVGGGIDGFLAAHSLLIEYPSIDKLSLVFFDYGQSSKDIELAMVQKQAEYFRRPTPKMPEVVVLILEDPLGPLLREGPNGAALCAKSIYKASLVDDGEVPLPKGAHDPKNKSVIENIKIYIPNRNARFVVQAFGLAELYRADVITLGAVGNVNMDNSLAFIEAACAMHKVSGDRPVAIYAPFVLMSKSVVALYANSYGLNGFESDNSNVLRDTTVSCFFPMLGDSDVYRRTGDTKHCGHCRSCLTLRQGFRFANVFDPYCYSN